MPPKARVTSRKSSAARGTEVAEAEKLGKLLSGKLCHVNLIEVNPVEGRNFKRGKNKYEFIKILEKFNVTATLRRELGKDISASCGQLKKSMIKGE